MVSLAKIFFCFFFFLSVWWKSEIVMRIKTEMRRNEDQRWMK